MTLFLHSFIVLIATLLGAIAGLGGGVIIKPFFDTIGVFNASTIAFYSSIAVFTMSVVSVIKQMKSGFVFSKSIVFSISLGSIIGGYLGELILNIFVNILSNDVIKLVQTTLYIFMILMIIVYQFNLQRIKQYKLKNKLLILLSGILLGMISVFLGIGGGPLNVMFMSLFFSFDMKESAVYSIATILCAQLSKLGMIIIKGQFFTFDLTILPYIMVCAVLGGYIGSVLNKKLSNHIIVKIYMLLLFGLVGLSVYNIIGLL